MKIKQNLTVKFSSIEARSRRKEVGATLLEAIAFLGIAAMVTLGAVSLLSGAFSSADAEKASNEVQALRTGAKKLASSEGGYSTLTMANLSTIGAMPGTIKGSGTIWTNSFGGAVAVTGDATNGGFTVSYGRVPRQACIDLVSKGQGAWRAISVGGTPATGFTLDAASTACANPANDLVFSGM